MVYRVLDCSYEGIKENYAEIVFEPALFREASLGLHEKSLYHSLVMSFTVLVSPKHVPLDFSSVFIDVC